MQSHNTNKGSGLSAGFATHLMEAGTNHCDIQEFISHKSIKTTEIDTHVSATSIQKVASPFDTL